MRKALFLLASVAVASMASAQHFKVVKTQRFAGGTEMFHPVFTPDGKSLLVTSEGYDGLSLFDLTTKSLTKLTSIPGAGYKVAVSADSKTAVCHEIHADEQKVSLFSVDLTTKATAKLASRVSHINNVNLVENRVQFAPEGKAMEVKPFAARKIQMKGLSASARNRVNVYVTEEDLKVVVYNNGRRTVVDPLSTPDNDVNYCWTSLSPNRQRILFVGHDDAYTCNLDGSGLVHLGKIHAPVWCGDEYVVGMQDKDDGYIFTKSDIVVVPSRGGQIQQLTPNSAEIKMFPSVSPDGKQIAYHTLEGKIYMLTIEKQ